MTCWRTIWRFDPVDWSFNNTTHRPFTLPWRETLSTPTVNSLPDPLHAPAPLPRLNIGSSMNRRNITSWDRNYWYHSLAFRNYTPAQGKSKDHLSLRDQRRSFTCPWFLVKTWNGEILVVFLLTSRVPLLHVPTWFYLHLYMFITIWHHTGHT